jgi:hypothetical protein
MILKRKNPLLVSAKILLLTLAFSVVTISCSDDDDDNSVRHSNLRITIPVDCASYHATCQAAAVQAVLELYPE